MEWLRRHNDAGVAAEKPVIAEEIGVNRTDPNLSQSTILGQYEEYVSSKAAPAYQGFMHWSCDISGPAPNVTACPAPTDPYAICRDTPDFTDLVKRLAGAMSAKGRSE